MPPGPTLGPDAWVDAAYPLFATHGIDAVRVEAVARTIGATKGSFYWHFAGRQALVDAVLARWEAETEHIVTTIENLDADPHARLAALFDAVTHRPGPRTGEQLLYAQTHLPGVAPAIERVTARRLLLLRRLFEEAGHDPADARTRASITLSTVIGAEHLAHATPALAPHGVEADRMRTLSLAMALGTTTPPEPQT